MFYFASWTSRKLTVFKYSSVHKIYVAIAAIYSWTAGHQVLQKSAPKQASLPPGDWLVNRRYVRWILFNAAMKQKQLVRTIVWLISCLAPRVLSSWHLSLNTSMHVIFPVGHVMCNHTLLSTTSNASKCVLQNKNRELLLLEEEILLTGESLRWIKEEIFVKETESDFTRHGVLRRETTFTFVSMQRTKKKRTEIKRLADGRTCDVIR